MGWEDRPYYRDRGASSNPLVALLSGSVPLLTVFGIRVRVHSALIIFILGELLFNWSTGYDWPNKIVSLSLLFGIVLIREFSHCAAARQMEGDAEEILLWPLGGLTFPNPPRRWGAHFATAAVGLLANAVLCVISAMAFYFRSGHTQVSFNPFHSLLAPVGVGWRSSAFYFWWVYVISYLMLLFNLLPVYPLDGGHMIQAVLWRFIGHYRSMVFACTTGMCGSALLGVLGLAQLSFLLIFLSAWLFYACYQQRIVLRETGPSEPWQDMDVDYSASLYREVETKRRRVSKRAVRIARKRARQEAMERQRLDTILCKVSAQGLRSLTWRERRALRRATEVRRKNEIDLKSYIQE